MNKIESLTDLVKELENLKEQSKTDKDKGSYQRMIDEVNEEIDKVNLKQG